MKEKRPLISVVTVCYQAKPYLEQCIQSVLSQEFDDFEYIIIDAGSTDGSTEIVERFADRLAYWHSKPDLGIADGFNHGVKNASGHWIVFLNADDYFASSMVLQEMSTHLLTHMQADVVYGQIQLVDRSDASLLVGDPIGADYQWSELRRRQNIPHPAAFTSHEYFDRVGTFDGSFRIAMDYEHYLRAGSALKASFVPLLVSVMREGGASKQNARNSLYEGYLAQIKTGALSKPAALIVYWMHVSRYYFSEILGNCKRLLRTSGPEA